MLPFDHEKIVRYIQVEDANRMQKRHERDCVITPESAVACEFFAGRFEGERPGSGFE